MDKLQHIVAIEIGSSKIIGAIATKSPEGKIQFEAMEEEHIVDCIRYGCIKNVEETYVRVKRIIQKLENRTSIAPRKIKSVYVGIGGRSLRIIQKKVEKSFSEDTTITAGIIDNMRKQAKHEILDSYEILDTVPCRFIVDNVEVKNPIGTLGSKICAYYDLIIGKEQIRSNIKRVLSERLQLNVRGYMVTALCTADQLLSYDERQLGCMLVDFGAETTTVSVYKENALLYMFVMPIGSRNITRDITSLKVLEETAEQIKRSIGNAMSNADANKLSIEGISGTEVSNYIMARSGEIVANIIEQLQHAGLTVADIPAGIVVIGGGAKLNGFVELIAQQTNAKVRKGAPNSDVKILESAANNLEYATIVSIVAKAAELIPSDVTCCEEPPAVMTLNESFSAGTTINDTVAAKADDEPKEEPKPKTRNRLSRLWDRLVEKSGNAFSDDDDDDENEITK